MPQLPASTVRTLRPQSQKDPLHRASAALGPVIAVPPPPPPAAPEEPVELNVMGPRKLIRPTLPARALRSRRFQRREDPVLVSQAPPALALSPQEASSHAESFYFQKQVQTQTPMVFVLEDGERIEGCIEWYDRNVLKVRGHRPSGGSTRTLIYKSGIKYLYKAGENQ